ncbi:MAG: MFS transporter [Asticcacaulis sp.]
MAQVQHPATDASGFDTSGAVQKPSNYRWIIVGLLLIAMIINYTHRQTFALLKGTVGVEQGWTEETYANIVFWFQCAYAFGYISFGGIIDKIGTRAGYGFAFSMWTLAHTLTGLVVNAAQFMVARFALGLGESGAFPASLKAISEWFPQRERALAVGIFNSGAAIGAIVAPLIIPMVTSAWGWRAAFFSTGIVSLLWLVAWFIMYRKPQNHKKVNAAELALIESDPADQVEKVKWVKLLFVKETWIYAGSKFLIDPVWWLYLFWLPDFLEKNYGLDLKSFGPPLIAIYLISDIGSVAGGWMSSQLLKMGLSVNIARKATLFFFALFVLPMLFVSQVNNLWLAVLIIGMAAAAHQAFSANVYTLPSDLMPRSAVASVIGIGGMFGAIGGMFMSKFVGFILETTHAYGIIFAMAAFTYLVAFAFIHLMSPGLKRNETLGKKLGL